MSCRRFHLAASISCPTDGVHLCQRWTPEFGQLAKVGSRPRRRSLECHGRDGVILLAVHLELLGHHHRLLVGDVGILGAVNEHRGWIVRCHVLDRHKREELLGLGVRIPPGHLFGPQPILPAIGVKGTSDLISSGRYIRNLSHILAHGQSWRPKAFPVGTAFMGGCRRWICYERPLECWGWSLSWSDSLS